MVSSVSEGFPDWTPKSRRSNFENNFPLRLCSFELFQSSRVTSRDLLSLSLYLRSFSAAKKLLDIVFRRAPLPFFFSPPLPAGVYLTGSRKKLRKTAAERRRQCIYCAAVAAAAAAFLSFNRRLAVVSLISVSLSLLLHGRWLL